MRIPFEMIEEIAAANDIIEVISSYIPVKKRGKSFIALCPFHPDKNPSLTISQEKQVYHCFACGAGGNVFTFVQEYEKVPFTEAAEMLALKAGIDLKIRNSTPDISNEISRLYEINKSAAKYFHENLVNNIFGAEKEYVFNYLKQRNLSTNVLKRYGIGYASNTWDNLKKYFTEESLFNNEDLEKAGLLVLGDNKSYYDRFRGRIMFPIFSENGKVLAFGGRKIFEEDNLGKYINSPESKIYNKSRILYGLNFSKENIRTDDYVILVEGYMDFISLFEAGVKNVVASSGTSLTEEQVKLISRYTNNIVILYDADLAGIKAAKRGIEIILSQNMDLSVTTLPEGEDPDSMIRNFGVEEFNKYLEKRKDIIPFISSLYEKENNLSSVKDKTNFVKEIINYISLIPDKIRRAFIIKELSQLYNLYESDLRTELNIALEKNSREKRVTTSVKLPQKQAAKKNSNDKNIPGLDKDLIEIFIKADANVVLFLSDNTDLEMFQNEKSKKIITEILDEALNEGKIDVSRLVNKFEDAEIASFLTGISNEKHEPNFNSNLSPDSILSVTSRKPTDYMKYANDVLRELSIRKIENDIESLKSDISNINKITELKKKINLLKKGNKFKLD
jgi:DNA primase